MNLTNTKTQEVTRIAGSHIAVGIALSFLSAFVLGKLWDAVQDKSHRATQFDHRILEWMNLHHTHALTVIANLLALLGSTPFVIGIALVCMVVGFKWGKFRGAAWLMPLAVLMSALLIEGIKLTVLRPRPTVFVPLVPATGYSFPSGHALISVVVYGLLGYFVMHLFKHPGIRVLVAVLTALLIISIGVSRVYGGVHYPTDVLAGWAAGLPWLISCIGMHEVLTRRALAAGEPVLEERAIEDIKETHAA